MNDWESLVEATIDAIHTDVVKKEVRIEMTAAWEGKDRQRVVATGVDDFLINEMRLSNIVDRVTRFSANAGRDDGAETASRLFFLMRGKEPVASDLQWPAFQEKLARINDGTLTLLEVEPVHGATVLILAENVRLEPMP